MSWWVKILLGFIFIESYCHATCLSRMDCGQCHYCDVGTGICHPVVTMEDPYNECPFICNTPTVCNEFQHCVLTKKPECDCDYSTGQCASAPPPPILFEFSEELKFNIFLTLINVFCFLFILIMIFWRFPLSLRPKKN